jgi:hypothetical protein
MAWVFTAGLLAGGALALAFFRFGAGLPLQRQAQTVTEELHPVTQQAHEERGPSARQAGHSVAVAPTVPDSMTAPPVLACGYDPMLAPSGPWDGRFSVEAALASRQKPSPAAFTAAAKQAAAEQRSRDTEVALIVACRLASGASSRPTVALADIQTRLGQHYLQAAPGQASMPAQAELLARAHELLANSLGAYTAVLGPDASKTRLAGRRLAAVAAASRPIDSPPENLSVFGAAMQPPAYYVRPGCENMPSAAQTIICSDPEFAQLDSDLRRLRAQAASVTSDPDGLLRRSEQAQARRDASCRDKACLLQWYGQRRRELIGEF